jgi:hypothetical protein
VRGDGRRAGDTSAARGEVLLEEVAAGILLSKVDLGIGLFVHF